MSDDYLYREFCTSFSVQMSRYADNVGQSNDEKYDLCWGKIVTPDKKSEKPLYRLRAKIARCTRAIFRTTKTPLPSKRIEKNFEAGVDAFLVHAYGDMFKPDSVWDSIPNEFEFFYSLTTRATKGRTVLTEKQFEDLFYKVDNRKSAIWEINKDVCGALRLDPFELMHEIRNIKVKRVNVLEFLSSY